MDPAGLVAMGMAGLWIAYLVPHRLRYRQQLLESRHDDRFSEALRVVRVARGTAPVGAVAPAGREGPVLLTAGRPPVRHAAGPGGATRGAGQIAAAHSTAPRAARTREGDPMERPHATRDRIVADAARRSAAEHAQRAAHLARRAAGARRRAALTALLLLAVTAGWTVVGVSAASVVAGAVPTVLLAGVLVLGRRAVVSGARADAVWHAGAATRAPLPASLAGAARVTGRAVRPSDATTEVLARIPGGVQRRSAMTAVATQDVTARAHDGATANPVRRRAEQPAPGSTWAPVPVPRPAYTLKPSARRAEPAPLGDDLAAAAGVSSSSSSSASASSSSSTATSTSATGSAPDASGGTSSSAGSAEVGRGEYERAEKTAARLDPASPVPVAQPAPFSSTGGIDLDAILARRRASGE